MGTIKDTLAEGTKGAQQLGLKRARVYSDLSPEDKDRTSSNTRNQATVQDGRWLGSCSGMFRVSKADLSATTATENGVALDESRQLLFIAGGQDTVVDEDVDEQLVHDLALNVDNVFQADDCDAFDSDVDEAPTA
ncbi:hypothetical protein Tco_0666604 [Tanacetum coccineum]